VAARSTSQRASALPVLHSMHAERQRPAAYMHADYTRFIGWSMSRCQSTSPTQRYLPRLTVARRTAPCEALLAPPARKTSGFGPSQPPCARYGAHGRPARRTQPHHYCTMVRTRCIRCAWRLGDSGWPGRNVNLLSRGADGGGPKDRELPLGSRRKSPQTSLHLETFFVATKVVHLHSFTTPGVVQPPD
jgi:hypothetical protein